NINGLANPRVQRTDPASQLAATLNACRHARLQGGMGRFHKAELVRRVRQVEQCFHITLQVEEVGGPFGLPPLFWQLGAPDQRSNLKTLLYIIVISVKRQACLKQAKT